MKQLVVHQLDSKGRGTGLFTYDGQSNLTLEETRNLLRGKTDHFSKEVLKFLVFAFQDEFWEIYNENTLTD